MISYIKGEITFNEGDTLVVENNGIGYEITVPAFSAQKLLSKGGEVTVYTYMSVREDGISLFGFESREEKAFYQKLISVSGIGPKAAISILSSITPVGAGYGCTFLRCGGYCESTGSRKENRTESYS